MRSVITSSCRCCIFVSCVHPVAVFNAAFCMTCKRRPHGRGILQSGSHDYLIGSHECLPHLVAVSAFIICRCLSACTSSSFVSSNRIFPFVYTFSGIFVELLKVIQSAGMC